MCQHPPPDWVVLGTRLLGMSVMAPASGHTLVATCVWLLFGHSGKGEYICVLGELSRCAQEAGAGA